MESNDELPESEDYALPQGTWPVDSKQRAFVDGAAWWQFHQNGSTMFASERDEAEQEAIRRYGPPQP